MIKHTHGFARLRSRLQGRDSAAVSLLAAKLYIHQKKHQRLIIGASLEAVGGPAGGTMLVMSGARHQIDRKAKRRREKNIFSVEALAVVAGKPLIVRRQFSSVTAKKGSSYSWTRLAPAEGAQLF